MPPPSPHPARVELYAARIGGMRLLAICLVVAMMAIGAPILALIAGVLAAFVSPAAGYAAGILVLLLIEAGFLILLLSLVRADAWLEGSVLAVRSALTTRRTDLARASDVTLRWRSEAVPVSGPNGPVGAMPTGRVPVLTVRDQSGGTSLRFTLIDPRTRKPLTGPALAALAGALQSGGPRPGRDPAALHHAIAGLHALATGPGFPTRK